MVSIYKITFLAGGWIDVINDVNNANNVTASVYKADGSEYKSSYLEFKAVVK
jgi:hypothetical protein